MNAVLGSAPQLLTIKTVLGANRLLALRVDGREALSHLPEYTVDAVGNASLLAGRAKVDLHDLLGTLARVTFDVQGSKRHIEGYVTRAVRGERHGRFDRYSIVLRPWLWFATRGKNSRVFQDKTVKQIVEAVLAPYEGLIDWRAEAELPTLEYCVQYEESDFDFVSRLLEEYGIYYFFEHGNNGHKLVLVDAMNQHETRSGSGAVKWSGKFDGDSRMINWHTMEEVRSAKAVVRDYDYLASSTTIEARASGSSSAASAKLGEAEIYEFPARSVLNQKDATNKSADKATEAVAQRIIEAAQSMQKLHSGECNSHDMSCGVTFQLSNAPQPDENGHYLIVSCDFRAEYGDHEAISDLKAIKQRRDGFVGSIQAISVKHGVFRPARTTPRPRMLGPQIATVVGAKGHELETEKHGRVKIKFPWDREGPDDENSSCWVRVAQPWAGKKMGLWMLPRAGHEVVVSFIGGDPDRPIVTGSVHNDENPPPYELPAHADVATWISHSTQEGAADAHNELRFCDTKDKEHVWFQGQKDFYRHVKGDTFDHLELNETRKVVKTVKEVVGENWYLNVGQDVMHDLGKDLHTKVAGDIFTTGGATWQVKLEKDYGLKIGADMGVDVTGKTALKSGGDVNVQSDGKINLKSTGNLVGEASGKVSLKSAADVLMEGINLKAKGSAEIVLEAAAGIKIVCGASVITLGPAGVTIDGPLVKVNCGGGGGAAGAAESAAAAEPKEVTEAKVQDELKPDKAEDYDKLLADPLTPPAETTSASAPTAPEVPDIEVPKVPVVPTPFMSTDAALGLAGTVAALEAMAGSAGASILQDALTEKPKEDRRENPDIRAILARSAGQEAEARTAEAAEEAASREAALQSQLDYERAQKLPPSAEVIEALAASAQEEADARKEELAGKDPNAKTQEQVLRDAEAGEAEARQAEEAGKDPNAKTEEQVLQDADAGEAEARQAEEAGKDPNAKTEEQVLQDAEAGEAEARQAEEAGKDPDAQTGEQVQKDSDAGVAEARAAEDAAAPGKDGAVDGGPA